MDFQSRIKQLSDDETVAKLAARLGVSRQTIYNWINGKNLPPMQLIERMGGIVWFPGDDSVEALLQRAIELAPPEADGVTLYDKVGNILASAEIAVRPTTPD